MTGPSGIARTAAGRPCREELALNPDVPRDAEARPCADAMRSDAGERGAECAAATGMPAFAGVPAASPAGAASDADEGGRDTDAPSRLSPSVYGALDLGTNNCRLLVAKPSRRGFLVIDAFSRIIRLGEGVPGTGQLSEGAHKADHRRASYLRRQDAPPRRDPLAPNRHGGVPDRHQWRVLHRPC